MTSILGDFTAIEREHEATTVLGPESCEELTLDTHTGNIVVLGGRYFSIKGNIGKLSIVCRMCVIRLEGCVESLTVGASSRANVIGDIEKAVVSSGGNLLCKGTVQHAFAESGASIFADSITERQTCYGGVILDMSQCTPFEGTSLE